jgi:hypothetical protein
VVVGDPVAGAEAEEPLVQLSVLSWPMTVTWLQETFTGARTVTPVWLPEPPPF